MTMTPDQIEAMRADMAAGTQGPGDADLEALMGRLDAHLRSADSLHNTGAALLLMEELGDTVSVLRTTVLAQARDIGILVANIRHLEECLGEPLGAEDAAIVAQIEAASKARCIVRIPDMEATILAQAEQMERMREEIDHIIDSFELEDMGPMHPIAIARAKRTTERLRAALTPTPGGSDA